MTLPRNDRLFWAFVLSFAAVFVTFYPATYGIEDEFNILSLSVAISRGTVLIDRAGLDLDADLLWNGHRISKFSPFHAALFVPAVATSWRLAFVVSALFVVAGAFVIRGMLRREGLPTAWVALYFLCAGLWFYSRTLMAAVPAAVMVLLGVSFLVRQRSRPAAAGAALSAGGLLHPWMIPVSGAVALGWWLDSPRSRTRPLLILAAAAAPGAAMLLLYNAYTTGSPFRNVYSLLGTQYAFAGVHFTSFAPLYVASLAVMPLAGWAALSPRWSGGLTIPVAVGAVLVMSSLYYYRDGIEYGLAGLLPAQRFLLPASLLACVPAARFLSALASGLPRLRTPGRLAPAAALSCFVIGFAAVSAGHAAFLKAHAAVQAAIKSSIPEGSHVLVSDRAFKEFAPVLGRWTLRQLRGDVVDVAALEPSYAVWIGPPGSVPPSGWFPTQVPAPLAARSWIWKRDVFIGARSPRASRPPWPPAD